MPRLYWEDFTPGFFAEYGPRRVTAEEIVAFAAEFDPQPMHLDDEAGRRTMVGGLCASGWHTCAIMMRIVADGFLNDSASLGATGCDQVQWLRPVRPGDDLTVRVTVQSTRAPRSRPEMGFVDFLFEVFNGSRDCVMTMTTRAIQGRRHSGAPVGEGAAP